MKRTVSVLILVVALVRGDEFVILKKPLGETVARPLEGLGEHQQGFIEVHPDYKPSVGTTDFNEDQREILRQQEEFRRVVAEANNQPIQPALAPDTNFGQIKSTPPKPMLIGGFLPEQFPPKSVGQSDQVPTPKLSFDDFPSRTGNVRRLEKPKGLLRDDELEARRQAEDAQYSFASSVTDSISDSSQFRQEQRDGLKVVGSYAYSDGFFKHIIHYEADENGYRVVGKEDAPIGNGPQTNVQGKADVMTNIEGKTLSYSVDTKDYASFNRKKPAKDV